MKGQFDLPTTTFFKLLHLAIIVVGVLAIFFSYIEYNIFIETRESEREALLVGNSLLSNDCLTYANTKSLFSEDKLNNIYSASTCLKQQYPYGNITITLGSTTWIIEIEDSSLGGEASFPVMIRNSITGERKLALMVVKV